MKNFESFRLIKKVQDVPEGYKVIDLKESRVCNPTLLCLGGNATRHEHRAVGYCDLVEKLVGVYPQLSNEQASACQVDVLSVVYGKQSIEAVEELANNMLLPLLTDDRGNALSVDDAKRNFNMLTIFCHCYGSVVLNGMVIYLQHIMEQDYGFSEQDTIDILSQITCVAHAPFNPISIIPALAIKTFEDDVVIDWTRCPFPKCQINGLKFHRASDNMLTLWSSRLANAHREIKDPLVKNLYQEASKIGGIRIMHDEHSPRILNRNDRWQLSSSGDEPYYVGENADAASQIAGYMLASSLASSIRNTYEKVFVPKPSLAEIESVGNDIISAFAPEDLMYKD